MLDFEEARRRILDGVIPLEPERIPLSAALGRVLAEDLLAEAALPLFDYSAMDGYAIRTADVARGVPIELTVAGECRAGDGVIPLPQGRALRIFTGAPLPSGADAIVIQEKTEREGDRVRILSLPRPFDHVRRRGEDLSAGSRALARGTRLGPFQLGLVAALDRSDVLVTRRPRLFVTATGNELRDPGSPTRDGAIPESNTYAIAALSTLAGAEARRAPRVPDDLAIATRAFSELLGESDVLVTIGGVSVGDHDVVREALARAGAKLEFWKVAIRPGKPFTFGRAGRRLVLGLPGNPVSAQVTFALFGLPLLRALQGESELLPRSIRVRISRPLSQAPGRLGVYRGRLNGEEVELDSNQASGATTSLSQADCLVFVPKELGECARGTELAAIRLSEL